MIPSEEQLKKLYVDEITYLSRELYKSRLSCIIAWVTAAILFGVLAFVK